MSKIKRAVTAGAHGVVIKQATLVCHQIGRGLAGTVWLGKLGANSLQEELESLAVVEPIGVAGFQEDILPKGRGRSPARSTLTMAVMTKQG